MIYRKIREELGLSVSEIAKKLKITRIAYYYYQQERRRPNLEIAMRIIKLCSKNNIKVTLDDLYMPRKIVEKEIKHGSY